VYRKQVRRRRAVLVVLVIASLVMISATFSEAESGPMHTVQRGVSAVLSPVEEGASRALKPLRDLMTWFDDTLEARGENEDLRAENAKLRAGLTDAQEALDENEQLRGLHEIDKSLGRDPELAGYEPVTARVIARSPTLWFSSVQIDHGTSSGVEVNDAVVSPEGLVGRVAETTRGAAQVELITDPRSAVTAKVVPAGPSGVLEPQVGDPEDLLLDFVEQDDEVVEGATLVTAGWSTGKISSAYPPGIEIGRVTETDLGDGEGFLQIHVEPFSDLRDLEYLQVLTGGPERPGLPQ